MNEAARIRGAPKNHHNPARWEAKPNIIGIVKVMVISFQSKDKPIFLATMTAPKIPVRVPAVKASAAPNPPNNGVKNKYNRILGKLNVSPKLKTKP